MISAKSCSLFLALVMAFSVVPSAVAKKKKKDDVEQIGNRKVAHRSLISRQKEIAIGKQYSTEIDRTARLVKDPVVNEYVNRVGQNLVRNSDATIPFTFKVIDNPALNAFALPGGFIYVHSGLLMAAEEEDELAGVLSHEIAHVTARHWASRMTKASIIQMMQIPLMIFTGGLSYPAFYGIWNAYGFAVPIAFMSFSRGAETESDYLGLQYMYKAGYDPDAYVSFFGKLLEQNRKNPGSVPKIFASHPPTPDRILKAEDTIERILPKRDRYLVTTSEFDDVKSRLQTVVSQMRGEAKAQEKDRPTLRRRPPSDGGESGGEDTDDKPPVLKRRD